MPVNSPFNTASPQAAEIASLYWFVLGICIFLLVVVVGSLTFILIRYRGSRGHEASKRQENILLEVAWTAIPLLMVGAIFGYTLRTMHLVYPPAGNRAPDIRIVAHQWFWEVHYPQLDVSTANEIHVPVGQDLLFMLNSADVIHDFWVPRLDRKIDVTPAYPVHLWMHVTKPGVYLGTCAEYCGAGHAYMRIRVVAQAPDEFAAWAAEQAKPHATPTTQDAIDGEKIFTSRTCANCHAVKGTSADGDVGPDLTHLGSRSTIASGAADNTPEKLSQWLKKPDSIKPGSHMPNLQLSDAEVRKLVAYLEG